VQTLNSDKYQEGTILTASAILFINSIIFKRSNVLIFCRWLKNPQYFQMSSCYTIFPLRRILTIHGPVSENFQRALLMISADQFPYRSKRVTQGDRPTWAGVRKSDSDGDVTWLDSSGYKSGGMSPSGTYFP